VILRRNFQTHKKPEAPIIDGLVKSKKALFMKRFKF